MTALGYARGGKTLFGKQLRLYAVGKGVDGADAGRITRGRCELDPDETWGCFSFRATSTWSCASIAIAGSGPRLSSRVSDDR